MEITTKFTIGDTGYWVVISTGIAEIKGEVITHIDVSEDATTVAGRSETISNVMTSGAIVSDNALFPTLLTAAISYSMANAPVDASFNVMNPELPVGSTNTTNPIVANAGIWSSTNPSIVYIDPITGVFQYLTVGTSDITYIVPNPIPGTPFTTTITVTA